MRFASLLTYLMLSVFAMPLQAKPKAIQHTPSPPIIDGYQEELWQKAQWRALKHHILGTTPEPHDFSGRFKMLWDRHKLYLLAEITDDALSDFYPDPKERYWDDDCLEIFMDSDASGGDHQFSHNAFAYHIGLDNQVADIGTNAPDGSLRVVLLNHHLKSHWRRQVDPPHKIIWEVAMNLYPDNYDEQGNTPPLRLQANQKIGFMLAYCDSDGHGNREHFFGSEAISPINGDKNLGYKTADVFGLYQFKENK